MARTASTGFFQTKCLLGIDPMSTTMYYLIDDSATVKVGDAITLDADGNARRSAIGEAVVGICTGFVTRTGLNVFTPQAQGLTGSTLTEDDQIAVSSTNTTDATRYITVAVNICPWCLYKNDADGDLARGQLLTCYDVLTGGNQIDQSTTSETSGQFQLVQLETVKEEDVSDASVGYFKINESQLVHDVGNSTDFIPA